jgi:hypothetical protein
VQIPEYASHVANETLKELTLFFFSCIALFFGVATPRKALQNQGRYSLARERALAEKHCLEEEARARDRWAHRPEMQPGSSINPSSCSRSSDVSRNTSNIPQNDAVVLVSAFPNQLVQDNQQQQHTRVTARSISISSSGVLCTTTGDGSHYNNCSTATSCF